MKAWKSYGLFRDLKWAYDTLGIINVYKQEYYNSTYMHLNKLEVECFYNLTRDMQVEEKKQSFPQQIFQEEDLETSSKKSLEFKLIMKKRDKK